MESPHVLPPLAILQALNDLIDLSASSSTESCSGLLDRLLSNLAHTKHTMAINGLDKQLLAVKNEYNLICNSPSHSHWEFVSESLSLLILLCSSLDSQNEPSSPKAAGNIAPAGLLSVKDEQTIKHLLQFISLFGIYPYLSPGVGLSLKARTQSALKLEKSHLSLDTCNCVLYKCVNALLHCTEYQVLSNLIKSSILDYDILTSLIQIVYSKNDKLSKPVLSTNNSQELCTKQLFLFVNNHHSIPSIVKTLLVLQGPPSKSLPKGYISSPVWFRNACGHLLSGLLMKKNGLLTVIRGIFGNSEDDIAKPKDVWLKCEAVAKVVSHCPSQVQSVSDYYNIICPQLLHLFGTDDPLLFKISCCILSAMLSLHKEEAFQYLGSSLFGPLLKISQKDSIPSVPLNELFSCVQLLHKITSVSEPGSSFFLVLSEYLLILFELWKVINKQQSKPAESNVLKAIIMDSLKSIELSDQINFFCHFVYIPLTATTSIFKFKQIPPVSFITVMQDRLLVFGERDVPQASCSEQVEELGESLIEILLEYSKASKTKLFRSVFMKCIDHLVSLLCKDSMVEETNQLASGDSTITSNVKQSNILLKFENENHSLSSAVVLYLVAGICERMGDKIITEIDNLTLFNSLSTIIKCHAASSAKTQQEVIITKEKENAELIGGHVTLSIALGLMSAFMSANEKIPMNMRPLLSSILPELHSISNNNKSSDIAMLAGELRICIATLGTVWSREALKTTTRNIHESQKETPDIITPTATKEKDHITIRPVPNILDNIFTNLNDPLIPVQGHSLIELARLIETKEQCILDNIDIVITTLNHYLQHNDSYIYIAAMRGIVAVSLIDPSKIITMLCRQYACFVDNTESDNEKGMYTCESKDDTGITINDQTAIDWIMKVGEVLVKVIKCLGDTLPFHADQILSALMINTRHSDPLLRASALSNLSELCDQMEFTFTRAPNEILSILSNILQFDTSSTVKQSAIVVIKNIFKNFNENSIKESQDYMLQLYRLLKHVESSDSDPLTITHAQAALGELDTIMRHMIFPVNTAPLTKKVSILQ